MLFYCFRLCLWMLFVCVRMYLIFVFTRFWSCCIACCCIVLVFVFVSLGFNSVVIGVGYRLFIFIICLDWIIVCDLFVGVLLVVLFALLLFDFMDLGLLFVVSCSVCACLFVVRLLRFVLVCCNLLYVFALFVVVVCVVFLITLFTLLGVYCLSAFGCWSLMFVCLFASLCLVWFFCCCLFDLLV